MSISIVIPIYNGQSTILDTLDCICKQEMSIDRLILINDNSTDRSLEILKNFKKSSKYHNISFVKIINNSENLGLAASYNLGFACTKSNLVVLIHQDVIFKNQQLKKLVAPFKDSLVVASTHHVIHPYKIWKFYGFWQKALFSRLLGKEFIGIDGKFDCFRRTSVAKVGYFNATSFKTAGEDGDMVIKLHKEGKIIDSKAKIIHVHQKDGSFTLKKYIFKHAQYAQAQGALLRLYGPVSITKFLKTFFREGLVIMLLIPYIQNISLLLIILYSVLYTLPVFTKSKFDFKKVVLPFVNIYLLFISAYYSFTGFIYKKEII